MVKPFLDILRCRSCGIAIASEGTVGKNHTWSLPITTNQRNLVPRTLETIKTKGSTFLKVKEMRTSLVSGYCRKKLALLREGQKTPRAPTPRNLLSAFLDLFTAENIDKEARLRSSEGHFLVSGPASSHCWTARPGFQLQRREV